jgi:predicted NAD-dependent protein-ADP-ribosyltransferase YbiA (DUF1768 family)
MATSEIDQHDSIQERLIDIQALKTTVNYNKNDCAWFFSKEDSRWELSNMAGGMPLKFDNKTWNSSEQLYQASKYSSTVICLPATSKTEKGAMPNVRARIEAMTNAKGAKMTQKCAVKAGLVRPDWDDPLYEIRIHSMLWVLELKLYHNPSTFGRVLKATGDEPIVEISKKDFFWGCKDMGNGILEGQNVLGKLLQIVRSRRSETMNRNYLYKRGFLLN